MKNIATVILLILLSGCSERILQKEKSEVICKAHGGLFVSTPYLEYVKVVCKTGKVLRIKNEKFDEILIPLEDIK